MDLKEIFRVYEEFSKLGNLALVKRKPVCEFCSLKDVCCLERKEVDVVFIFPFEKEFIESKLNVKIPIKVLKTKYGEIHLLKHFNSRCIFWDKNRRCKIFKFAPIDCRTYPYSISYEKEKKRFFLIRYKECQIIASNKKIRKLKALFEKLIEILPGSFWKSFDEIDKKIFKGKKDLFEKIFPLDIKLNF